MRSPTVSTSLKEGNVFETGIRQLRMAIAMVRGRPINPQNLRRLIQDALKTLEEFGAPGDDVQELLEGPFSDPALRRDFQNRSLQRTARRLARVSPYYSKLFATQSIDPANITVENIHQLPLTYKQALQEQQQEFIAQDARPTITTRTTGTTGRPTEIWLSQYELELWPAFSALSGLLRNEISPDDCMQINVSSRATAAVQVNIEVCRLAGARSRVLGLIPPEESLESLLSGGEEAPTLLSTYASYLAQLVKVARSRNLGPRDFRLRRIDCGGEVLSSALARAAQETFGAVVNDIYAMTETLPVSGRVCNQGHLHSDLNMGFVEVIDLDTGEPTKPGALGSMVVTPYYPYRECMPIFRYATRDIVRRLPEERLTCNLAGVPATSRVLGKANQILRVNNQSITPRDLVEVLEALPTQPWPARFKAQVVDGQIELTLPEQMLGDISSEEIERRFRAADMRLRVLSSNAAEHDPLFRPLRADLLEATFAARRN
jgi:phenylacetate-CoA ligase